MMYEHKCVIVSKPRLSDKSLGKLFVIDYVNLDGVVEKFEFNGSCVGPF